jgi:hypothetical protein
MMFLVPTVFASVPELDYVLKTNSRGEINRPCFNSANADSGGWCSNDSQCQLSVFNAANKQIIAGFNMTNKISTHNITLPILNETGIYSASMACKERGNLSGYDTFQFGVNDAGRDYTGMSYILYIIGGLALLFGVFAFYLNEHLRLAFILLTILMLPLGLWVGLDLANNTWMGQGIINIIATGFYVSLIGFGAMVLYTLWDMTMALRIRRSPINSYNLSAQSSPLKHNAYAQKKAEYAEKHKDREYQ